VLHQRTEEYAKRKVSHFKLHVIECVLKRGVGYSDANRFHCSESLYGSSLRIVIRKLLYMHAIIRDSGMQWTGWRSAVGVTAPTRGRVCQIAR